MDRRTCGQEGRAFSRSHRAAREGRYAWPLFNQPRAVVSYPRVETGLIALASLPLGLLRCDVAFCQPATKIVRAERDAEGPLDQVRNTPAFPMFQRAAKLPRAPFESGKDSLNLSVGEFRHASQGRLARQLSIALFVVTGLPFLGGPKVNAEELANIVRRMAMVKTLDRQQTTLQFGRGSFASHAWPKVHPQSCGNGLKR